MVIGYTDHCGLCDAQLHADDYMEADGCNLCLPCFNGREAQ